MKKYTSKASRAKRTLYKKFYKAKGRKKDVNVITSSIPSTIFDNFTCDLDIVALVNSANDLSIKGVKAKTDYPRHISKKQIQEWYNKSISGLKHETER